MSIDEDVARISAHFGIDPRLIQAVVKAEGDILKAVRCSVPTCKDRAQALEITCRSAVHAMSDYIKSEHAQDWVEMWSRRWAPVGVANDPTALNQFWPKNVLKMWIA